MANELALERVYLLKLLFCLKLFFLLLFSQIVDLLEKQVKQQEFLFVLYLTRLELLLTQYFDPIDQTIERLKVYLIRHFEAIIFFLTSVLRTRLIGVNLVVFYCVYCRRVMSLRMHLHRNSGHLYY